MGINLHGLVRGAISAINTDRNIVWRASTGNTIGASGLATPTYATPATVSAQVQPVAGDMLAQLDFLNQQGVHRHVYVYGSLEGIVRPALKGGDLLTFPLDGVSRVWLVAHVVETWVPQGEGVTGWCSVIATLQEDAP